MMLEKSDTSKVLKIGHTTPTDQSEHYFNTFHLSVVDSVEDIYDED